MAGKYEKYIVTEPKIITDYLFHGKPKEEPFRIYDSLESYESEVLGGSSSAGD